MICIRGRHCICRTYLVLIGSRHGNEIAFESRSRFVFSLVRNKRRNEIRPLAEAQRLAIDHLPRPREHLCLGTVDGQLITLVGLVGQAYGVGVVGTLPEAALPVLVRILFIIIPFLIHIVPPCTVVVDGIAYHLYIMSYGQTPLIILTDTVELVLAC